MKFRTQQKGFQLTLDCGQKEFGSTKCLQCHMVYTPGDKEDIKAHKKYHQFKLFPFVRLPRGRHQQVIQENLNGSRVVELLTDCRLGQGFYERISSLLNKEFGYDQPLRKSNSSCVNGSGMSLCPDWRVFVHVIDRTQQVVGCCVVEELTTKKILTKGYKLNRLIGGRKALLSWSIQSADQNQTNHNSIPLHFEDTLCTDISGPICGVRRLWVERDHRRRGIATSLLDAVLQNLVYSLPLPRTQIAFAEPTADGADFAVSYVGREDILIY